MTKALFISLLLLIQLQLIAHNSKKIKFTAVIENRKSDTLLLRGENAFIQKIPINTSKQFTAIFDAPKGFYQLYDGHTATTLYLKPQSDITLTYDADQFPMSLVYKGFGSEESNFLAQYNINEEKFSETAFAKEPADFEKLLVDKSAKERESLQKGNYDPEFKTLILSSLTNNDRYTLQTYKNVLKTKKLQGTPSPIFDFDNNTGGSTKLSDLKGKYIYIDIWATWCAPCRQEIPYLEKLEKKYKEKNITFVSISIDEKKDYQKWKEFISAKKLGGIQLIADKDWNSDFILQYEVRGIPRFILIDPNGNIVSSDAPRPSNPKLQDKLDLLLQ